MSTISATAIRRPVRAVVAGLVAALAITSTLGAVAPQPALAAAGTASTSASAWSTQKPKGEYGGTVMVTLPDGFQDPAAILRKIDGKWYATFTTVNGTWLYGVKDGGSWKIYAKKGNQFIEVVHSNQGSYGYGCLGPKGRSSNWRTANGWEWV